MAEVVGGKLHLEPVLGPALGDAHHTGVVDQDVDPAVTLEDPGRRLADRRLRAEVELDELERRLGHPGADDAGRAGGLVLVAGGHHHMGALGGQRARGLEPKPPVRAGHHRRLTGQVGDVGLGPAHDSSSD